MIKNMVFVILYSKIEEKIMTQKKNNKKSSEYININESMSFVENTTE